MLMLYLACLFGTGQGGYMMNSLAGVSKFIERWIEEQVHSNTSTDYDVYILDQLNSTMSNEQNGKTIVLKSFLYSCSLFGIATGSVITYFLSSEMTRKQLLVSATILQIIMSTVSFFTKNISFGIYLMIATKFFLAIGQGSWFSAVIPYLYNYAQTNINFYDLLFSTLFTAAVSMGLIIGAILNFEIFFNSEERWHYLELMGLSFSVPALLGLLIFDKNSIFSRAWM